MRYFGSPNGKESVGEVDRNSSWFFNGYKGRKGTDLGWYQTENVIPDKFEFSVGGFHEGYCSVVFKDSILIYCPPYSLIPKFHDVITDTSPSPSDWKKFWKKVESIGVWKWKKNYTNHDIDDGTQWEIKLKINGRTKNVYGSNEDPDKFNTFLKAVSILVGGLPIH